MKRRIAITAATLGAYLAALALGIAGVWTSRGIDMSSALGATAGLVVLAMVVAWPVGLVLLLVWED